MSQTTRLGLPFVMPAQAQKHVTVNESLRRLDVLVQTCVVSASTAAEPAAPAAGDAFILTPERAGATWSAMRPGSIAAFQDGAFAEIAPVAGQLAFVRDEGALRVFDGANWASVVSPSLDASALFGVNAEADAVNRLSVKADAELLSHDDVTPGSGDARKIINKAALGRTAAVLFQSGFSGRAEIGLLGSDALSFKVSSDGATFREILRMDAATGNLGVRRAVAGSNTIGAALHVGGPSDPAVRVQEDGTASYAEIAHKTASQSVFSHVSQTGAALIDISPRPVDTVGAATLRVFRDTVTTATASLEICVGDGGANANHKLNGNAHSFLCAANKGSLKVGDAAPPVCTLDVAGPVRVKSYTVATLPAASAGSGQIVLVSNESGGSVLAFSDGSSWRRVTDRVVVS